MSQSNCLWSRFPSALVLAVCGLSCVSIAIPSFAGIQPQQIAWGCSGEPNGGLVIDDGRGDAAGDTPGLIIALLSCSTADWTLGFTVIAEMGPTFAKTTVTDLTFQRISPGPPFVQASLEVFHENFELFPGISQNTAHLDGEFQLTGGTGSFGEIFYDARAGNDTVKEFMFNSDDDGLAFNQTSKPKDIKNVDRHSLIFTFFVGIMGDTVFLPDSATVVTTPAPATLPLLALGGLIGRRRRR